MATGSGTGTPTVAAGGITLADLRATCRLVLSSTSDWPNASIDAWIRDAIRMYSLQMPRRWRHTLTLATGTQAYDIPGGHGFQNILAVEYPAGEDPPKFVDLVSEWDAKFGNESAVYALRGITDTTAISADTVAATIVFAETVTTGETAVIEYLGDWPLPTTGVDTDLITIPAAHTEALVAFVDFRGHWELETNKAYSVSTISIVLAQLGEEARKPWIRFKEIMNAITEAPRPQTSNPTWSYG